MDFLEIHKEHRVQIWENILLIPELKKKITELSQNWEFSFQTHYDRDGDPYDDLISGPYFLFRPVGKSCLLDHSITDEISFFLPFGFVEATDSTFEYNGPFEDGLKMLLLAGWNWDGEYPKFLNASNYKYYGHLIDYDAGMGLYELKERLEQEIKFSEFEK